MGQADKRKTIKNILMIYLNTRLVILILMILANSILPSTSVLYDNVFELYDNEHYLSIAENGYIHKYQYAFFPLTSMLVKLLSKPGFLIANQLFVIITGFLLYSLSTKNFKLQNPLFVTALWFISPISVFTCMFYSEALFVFLTVLAYYLYKNQKHYLLLGTTLGLSVMARNLGSVLFFTIFIFMLIDAIRGKEKIKNIIMSYVPATIISCIYPIYLYIKTGDLLYFATVQFEFWNRKITSCFTIVFDSIKLLLNDFNILYCFNFVLTFIIISVTIYLIIKNRKNKNYYDMYLYMLLTIIAICSSIRDVSDATTSFYRYLYGCFPIYFIMPHTKLSKYLHNIFFILITVTFLMGIYFF